MKADNEGYLKRNVAPVSDQPMPTIVKTRGFDIEESTPKHSESPLPQLYNSNSPKGHNEETLIDTEKQRLALEQSTPQIKYPLSMPKSEKVSTKNVVAQNIAQENTSANSECTNYFDIDMKVVCKYNNGGAYKEFLSTVSKDCTSSYKKDELYSFKILKDNCLKGERCMITIKTADNEEIRFLQMMVEKLNDIATVRNCSLKDILSRLNKSEMNISKFYEAFMNIGS